MRLPKPSRPCLTASARLEVGVHVNGPDAWIAVRGVNGHRKLNRSSRPKAAVAFAAPSLVVSDSYMSFVGHLELIQPGSKVLNGSLARVTRTVLVFCRSEQESVKPRLAASVRPGNREPPYLVDADGPTEESLVLTRCLQSIDP